MNNKYGKKILLITNILDCKRPGYRMYSQGNILSTKN